jgi:hypothetical protein
MVFNEYGLVTAKGVKKIKIGNDLKNIVNMVGRVDERKKVQTKQNISP